MNEPAKPPPDQPPRTGHETTDASPAVIGLFALGLVIMIALVLPLLNWIYWRMEASAERRDVPLSSMAGKQVVPEPRLETDTTADLTRLRASEDERLSSYGWVDAEHKAVRIPVDRAIEILAERGLPEPEGPLEMPNNEGKPQ
jgi:hypothetical protein